MASYVPRPFAGSFAEVEKSAEEVSRYFADRHPRDGKPVADHLREVVKGLGGSVEVTATPSYLEEEGGSLYIEPSRRFRIVLSPRTIEFRDNFTIAHELGHYFLHYPHQAPPSEPVTFNRYGDGIIEWQANRFAAALLMPAVEFKRVKALCGGDPVRIAAHFEVSRPAAEVRLKYM